MHAAAKYSTVRNRRQLILLSACFSDNTGSVVCSFIPLICVCISTLWTSLTKQSSFIVMGRSKLNNKEKVRVLTLANEGMSNRDICIRTGRSMQTIRMLKKAAVGFPPNTIPERKKGSGRPRKISKRTDAMLKREVMVIGYCW